MAKVSDLIADFLEQKKIRKVFGIIGSGNAHIFDSITQKGYTEIVCVHHEQAAVMAMQIYYRTSGELSACLLTTGAGSTNAVTGVVSAWMDSIPGIMISGNENSKFTRVTNPLRIWGIQGYDSVAMVEKVTKYAARVLEPEAITRALETAYHITLDGRPGPVWIDVPMNIQAAPVELSALQPWVKPAANVFDTPELRKQTAEVVSLLKSAKRPVLWLGHGIRLANAAALVQPLVEALGVPTLVSWAGIDLIDSSHPLVFGRAGVYGQRAANFVLQNCDLLITIGTRLAVPQVGYELSEFARAAKVVVVDIDVTEAKKHGDRIQLPICTDAKAFMVEFSKQIAGEAENGAPKTAFARPDWLRQANVYRDAYPWVGPEHADKDGFINSYRFMKKCEDFFKPNQLIVTDMGTALLSGHQVLSLKKGQRLMTSTGLGEMGYGLPAAIGAAFGYVGESVGDSGKARGHGGEPLAQNATAEKRGDVLCLNCDGGMMMNLQELQTIVHHQLPIKIIIFNNDGYLMIKHTQKALFQGRYSGTDKKSGVTCPDFTKLAAGFGMPAYQIRTWADMDSVMPKVQEHKGPVICEVFMHPEQLFVPKLSLAPQKDGSIVSPPLEDLWPLLPRDEVRRHMVIGMHPKSEAL